MKGNIIFIGGIHGVGKGTLCKNIASELNVIHLTASDVLKWDDFTTDSTNKCVKDIQVTQNRLICNLRNIILPEKFYLLDGHFCLLNNEGIIEKIPDQTFIEINPIKFVLVTENPETICWRLEKRDEKKYDANLLKQMQEMEKEHALHISKLLSIELFEIQPNSIDKLKTIINNQI